MKNFKSIADELMCDITVREELAKETLQRCTKKKKVSISKFLVPAACFVILLGSIHLSGVLTQKPQTPEQGTQEMNLMMGTVGSSELYPDPSVSISSVGIGEEKTWVLSSTEEVERNYGSAFLKPSYIPKSFALDKIQMSGMDEQRADRAILSYFAGEVSFLIIQEKNEMPFGFENFNEIDINGVVGYVKPRATDENNGKEILDTEVHWYKDGNHYAVMGLIKEEEAIKIARSMK